MSRTPINKMKVGDEVYIMYCGGMNPVTIIKVNSQSFTVKPPGEKTYRVPKRHLVKVDEVDYINQQTYGVIGVINVGKNS